MKKFIILLFISLGIGADDFKEAVNAYKNHNYTRASELFKIACDNNDTQACAVLGSMYYDGTGIAQDYEQARQLHQKACDGKNEFETILS